MERMKLQTRHCKATAVLSCYARAASRAVKGDLLQQDLDEILGDCKGLEMRMKRKTICEYVQVRGSHGLGQ